MRMTVAIFISSAWIAEGVRLPPETIANVSVLLAHYFGVDCIQIFRTDDFSLEKMDFIHKTFRNLATVESELTTGIYTFARYLKRKTKTLRKVSCYRSLKILSNDEESSEGYAKFSVKFTIKDAVWVLYTDDFSVGFFSNARVVFDDVIVIAVVKNDDFIEFHEVYRVSQDFPLKVLSLGNWTRDKGLHMVEDLMYDRRSDLEGVVVRTAKVPNWPASYLRNGQWQGFIVKLWEEVAALINCTSVDVKGESVIGMRQDNGSWSGLIGSAMRDEIDVIVSEVVIDKERSHALDFFHPILKTKFQIYTRHLGYQWQWASVLKPFDKTVWAAAVGWVIAATISWTFIHWVCKSEGLESMDFEKFVPLGSFFFVLQSLCQQGCHYTPSLYACRVLFFVSYAMSSVLIPSYSASLVSSLARKITLKSFDSLEEMVKDGTYRLLVKQNTAQYALFVNSKTEILQKAFKKLVEPVPESMKKYGIMEAIKALCRLDKYAVIGLEDVIEGRLHHLFTLDCPIVHLKQPVTTVHLTMAASKNNPYWGVINHHLGKLLITGVAKRLRRSEFPLSEGLQTRVEKEVEVGMLQVISIFLFIGFFTVLAACLLLLELQYEGYRKTRNRMRRKKRNVQSKLFLYEMTKRGNKWAQTWDPAPGFYSK